MVTPNHSPTGPKPEDTPPVEPVVEELEAPINAALEAEAEEESVSVDPETQPDSPEPETAEITDLSQIHSWDDAKEYASEEVDKLMNSSSDEIKEGALRVGNRLFQAYRRFRDG